MWLPYADMLSRLDTIPEHDRWMDGQTELLYQYRVSALLCQRVINTDKQSILDLQK